jgi:poly(3-hydroxybutyrate) depolymerase
VGLPTGLLVRSVMASNVARRYQLLVPAAHTGTAPMRLIFVFHGLGGDGDQIRSYFGFEAEAAGQALFVYPDGLVRLQGRTGWGVEDLPFFDAMVDDIAASYCVDRERIFATGHSFGAYMSNQVACERGNMVRAIAVASGGLLGGTCAGPVAAWLEHGTTDATVPQRQALAARDHWLTTNGCSTTATPVAPSPCVTYDGCSVGHPVTWCSFQGGHYPLPAFGKQAIWDFLRAL